MSLDLKTTLCSYDSQNRCLVDINTFLYEGEERCAEISRDSLLGMFNQHAHLLTKETSSVPVYTAKTLCFPRSKAIPKAKPKTRWEKFATKKGIVKKKKSHLVYNERRKEWVPRFGGRVLDETRGRLVCRTKLINSFLSTHPNISPVASSFLVCGPMAIPTVFDFRM